MTQQKSHSIIEGVGEGIFLIFLVIFATYLVGCWSVSISQKSTVDYKVPNEDEIKQMLIGRQIPVGDSIWFFKAEDELAISNIWGVRLKHGEGSQLYLWFDVATNKGDDRWLVGTVTGTYDEESDKLVNLAPQNIQIKKGIE
jgi:hypothetical protein